MKRILVYVFALALAARIAAADAPLFQSYTVTVATLGEVTVIDPQGEPGYRVRLADGRVTAYAAHSGQPSEANAAADIAHALSNPAPASPPATVSRRQLLLALYRGHAIKEADITAKIAEIPDAAARYEADVEFRHASEFQRAHALVATLAAAFGLTSGQVDTVFRNAAEL